MADYDLDLFLRHQLYLERLATGGQNKLLDNMQEVYLDIRRLLNEYETIPNRRALNKIVKEIQELVLESKGWDLLTQENLKDLAIYEATWQASYQTEMTGLSAAVPSEAQVLNFINSSLMSLTTGQLNQTGVWSQFTEQNLNGMAEVVNNIVKRGFVRGETIGEIQKQIRQANNGIIRRNAVALARTGYIHYAAQANEAMIQANSDILDNYFYVVTFDNRTSDICIGITKFNEEGNRFKVGDPAAPIPPLHYQCRTRRMAVPKNYQIFGTKAAVGGNDGEDAAEAFKGKKDRLRTASQVRYKGRKSNDIFNAGPIDARLSYEKWLKQQPRWFIDDTLGPKRASLLIDRKIPLNNFSDMTGKPLTIDEIIQRESKG